MQLGRLANSEPLTVAAQSYSEGMNSLRMCPAGQEASRGSCPSSTGPLPDWALWRAARLECPTYASPMTGDRRSFLAGVTDTTYLRPRSRPAP